MKIDPSDYHLFGLKLDQYYLDTCLPFRFKHGSSIFQTLSDAIRFIMTSRGYRITNYTDDLLQARLMLPLIPSLALSMNLVSRSRRDLQSLLGQLLYITKCVRASRVFLNHMLALLRASEKLELIQLSKSFKQDLNWFCLFLPTFNGTTVFSHKVICLGDAIRCLSQWIRGYLW